MINYTWLYQGQRLTKALELKQPEPKMEMKRVV
jgi:hypothetical protein